MIEPSAKLPLKLVVLISGNGGNLQAIIDAIQQGTLYAKIALVVSNRADAAGLKRAEKAGIKSLVVSRNDYSSRERYDETLASLIAPINPGLIVLAGFMWVLGADFIMTFADKVINIHPSLLPKYKGLNTHERVLRDGGLQHGCSVHYVTEDLDAGPVIVQGIVNITSDDNVETVQTKVQRMEHKIYPFAIQHFSLHRVSLKGSHIYLDQVRLTSPLKLNEADDLF